MASVLKLVSRFATSTVTSVFNGSRIAIINPLRQSSTLTSVCRQFLTPCALKYPLALSLVSTPTVHRLPQLQQCRTYKVRTSLKLRCSSCYFVKRSGRLFVECKAKPRHKQMQSVARRNLFRDDYTIGSPAKVSRACFYKYRQDRYYDLGNNKYSQHNWLEGKIGHTI